ncbi:MAG: glycoside hydrolase family 130 protein [Spirochaetia bacterium]|jgi:beta-1,4-mannooligosaccharide/beta-1,4-mannosyl-N-acetylglucosamine phosphorylase
MAGKQTILGDAVRNLPWEEKPKGSTDVLWRHSGNPIIPRYPFPGAQGVYNSAAIAWKDAFLGVMRVEHRDSMPRLHLARSRDGIHWDIEREEIRMTGTDPDISRPAYTYDPRVCRIDDDYYVTWCNDYHGPTIGIARTRDFQTFEQLENAFLPYNRNGVLFPRKLKGMYLMLSRPSDNGHTPFGDIYVSESPDLVHWGRHRWVMGRGGQWWQSTKIGAGPIPIETTEGWLLFYHGVITNCNGFVYSMGAALLDRDNPARVLYRTNEYLLAPAMDYETVGFVPNVCFPCAAISDAPSGRIALYYGAADTYTALCFCQVDEVLDFLKGHSTVF